MVKSHSRTRSGCRHPSEGGERSAVHQQCLIGKPLTIQQRARMAAHDLPESPPLWAPGQAPKGAPSARHLDPDIQSGQRKSGGTEGGRMWGSATCCGRVGEGCLVQTRRQPEPEIAAVPSIGTKGPKGPLNGDLEVKCAEGA